MTEKMLNELVSGVVVAMQMEGSRGMTEELLFDLMYRHENIYQIVFSKYNNRRKARSIKREMSKLIEDRGEDRENMTLRERLKATIAERRRERGKKVLIKKKNWDGIRYNYNGSMKISI